MKWLKFAQKNATVFMYTDQQKPNLLQLTKLGKSFSKLLNVELMICLFSPSNVTVTCYI